MTVDIAVRKRPRNDKVQRPLGEQAKEASMQVFVDRWKLVPQGNAAKAATTCKPRRSEAAVVPVKALVMRTRSLDMHVVVPWTVVFDAFPLQKLFELMTSPRRLARNSIKCNRLQRLDASCALLGVKLH